MGPKPGLAQMPAARLPFGKSIVVPGLLNWISTIGWDGINSLFGAFALTILIPALPFVVALLIIVVCQGSPRDLRLRGDPPVREVGRDRPRGHVRRPDRLDPRPGRHVARPTASAAPTRSARSSPTWRSWRASSSPGRCTHPTTGATCPRRRLRRRIFWYTLLGMALASGWLEILGLLVAGKATGGESSDTIFSVLGGSGNIIAMLAMVAIAVGTVAVNAMNDYTGSLSLQAAGIRVKRIYSAALVAVLGFLFTLYLQSPTTSPATSRTSCCSSATGSRRSSAWSWPTGCCARQRADVSSPRRLRITAERRRRPGRDRGRVRRSGSRSRTRRSATTGAARSTTSRPTTCTAPTSPTTWAGSWPSRSTGSGPGGRSAPRPDRIRDELDDGPGPMGRGHRSSRPRQRWPACARRTATSDSIS